LKTERPPEGGFPRRSGQTVYEDYRPTACTCNPRQAAEWLAEIIGQTLDGDENSYRLLAAVVQHYPDVVRREGPE
jgi:hypothetical protein